MLPFLNPTLPKPFPIPPRCNLVFRSCILPIPTLPLPNLSHPQRCNSSSLQFALAFYPFKSPRNPTLSPTLKRCNSSFPYLLHLNYTPSQPFSNPFPSPERCNSSSPYLLHLYSTSSQPFPHPPHPPQCNASFTYLLLLYPLLYQFDVCRWGGLPGQESLRLADPTPAAAQWSHTTGDRRPPAPRAPSLASSASPPAPRSVSGRPWPACRIDRSSSLPCLGSLLGHAQADIKIGFSFSRDSGKWWRFFLKFSRLASYVWKERKGKEINRRLGKERRDRKRLE